MFENLSESALEKVYDWITYTFYSPDPTWNKNETNERIRALHVLNDMRALYSAVGNNGYWDPDRLFHLDELDDILPPECDEVLLKSKELERYYTDRGEAQDKCFLNGEEFDWDEYMSEYGTDLEKMQGNKDGELYKYTSGLFWGTVEWFINSYAIDEERQELLVILSKTAAKIN